MLNKILKGAIFNRQKNKIKCKKKPVKIYIWEAYSPFEQEWGRSRWRVISGGIFLHVYLWQLNLVLQKTLEYCVLEQKREFKQPLLVTPCLHHGEKQPPQSSKNDVKFKKKKQNNIKRTFVPKKVSFSFFGCRHHLWIFPGIMCIHCSYHYNWINVAFYVGMG